MNQQAFHGFSDEMFESKTIGFHTFKTGEHKFRVLPPYAPNKLFHKVGLHWGFSDVSGHKKALTCSIESHGTCPICETVDAIKGQVEALEAAKVSCLEVSKVQEYDKMIGEKNEQIGAFRRKPTYLWNILTSEGEQKVLQLSWNGHDPLHNKVQFYWKEKRINVTDPTANYLIYCSRTGAMAKTRYIYEVLDQSVKAIEFKALKDLSKIYAIYTPEELSKILKNGVVEDAVNDPNDRNFNAAPVASKLPTAPVAPTLPTAPTLSATPTLPAVLATPTLPAVLATPTLPAVHSLPPVNANPPAAKVELTAEQDKTIADMMNALKC